MIRDQVSTELDKLVEQFEKLRISYEKYFAGVDRLEPLKSRDTFKRTLRRLQGEQTPNTSVRFRMQTLQASLVTYENYWNRVTRQIEEGTYRRDVWRARHQMQADEEGAGSPEAASMPQGAVAEGPASALRKGYPASIQKLYEAFVAARSKVGDTRPVSIDKLAALVTTQVADIKNRYNCATVEFKVTISEGKVVLKAAPKPAKV